MAESGLRDTVVRMMCTEPSPGRSKCTLAFFPALRLASFSSPPSWSNLILLTLRMRSPACRPALSAPLPGITLSTIMTPSSMVIWTPRYPRSGPWPSVASERRLTSIPSREASNCSRRNSTSALANSASTRAFSASPLISCEDASRSWREGKASAGVLRRRLVRNNCLDCI